MSAYLDALGLTLIGALILMIGYSLWKVQRDPTINFNLLDMLIENGRVSKVSAMVLAAFTATTWAFIFQVLKHGLDAGILVTYGGLWVSPLLVRILGGTAPNPPEDKK